MQSPNYLFRLIPKQNTKYVMRNSKGIPQCRTSHEYCKNSFIPVIIKEWNKIDSDIWSSESLNVFKSKVLKFIRPKANTFVNCLNPKGVKLITRLRLGLSHLRDQKFKQFSRLSKPYMQVRYWRRNNWSFSALLFQLLTWKKNPFGQHQICPSEYFETKWLFY